MAQLAERAGVGVLRRARQGYLETVRELIRLLARCGSVGNAAVECRSPRGDDLLEIGPFRVTPAQLVEQMQPFVELGVDYFMLDCGGFPRLTTVELLIEEVLPALNR